MEAQPRRHILCPRILQLAVQSGGRPLADSVSISSRRGSSESPHHLFVHALALAVGPAASKAVPVLGIYRQCRFQPHHSSVWHAGSNEDTSRALPGPLGGAFGLALGTLLALTSSFLWPALLGTPELLSFEVPPMGLPPESTELPGREEVEPVAPSVEGIGPAVVVGVAGVVEGTIMVLGYGERGGVGIDDRARWCCGWEIEGAGCDGVRADGERVHGASSCTQSSGLLTKKESRAIRPRECRWLAP